MRFSQEFKGVPVLASEVVVNLHADSRLHSLYNQYHYDIPPAFDTTAKVSPWPREPWWLVCPTPTLKKRSARRGSPSCDTSRLIASRPFVPGAPIGRVPRSSARSMPTLPARGAEARHLCLAATISSGR